MLTEECYQVQTTMSTVHALTLAREWQPHLILFDMSLYEHSGEDFVKIYRSRPGTHAAMIAVSGVANLEDAAAKLGADGYLTKPFDLDELLNMVATALGRAT